MYEICAHTFLEGTFMFASCFLVCARLTTCVCVCAHMHSVAGTLNTTHMIFARDKYTPPVKARN